MTSTLVSTVDRAKQVHRNSTLRSHRTKIASRHQSHYSTIRHWNKPSSERTMTRTHRSQPLRYFLQFRRHTLERMCHNPWHRRDSIAVSMREQIIAKTDTRTPACCPCAPPCCEDEFDVSSPLSRGLSLSPPHLSLRSRKAQTLLSRAEPRKPLPVRRWNIIWTCGQVNK
ncbi:hypothetical protein BGY98DRAFT_104458 [Russula aff. rugulosa BPL654]|nr:hypothetical protein BGY98DRAFT_104458 [Russula aff. rugulosa BPL654]